jgi:hypothetical protein
MAISMDMKYTALYWALRFVENELDIHVKYYGEYKVVIDAEHQKVDYGSRIKVLSETLKHLKRHKDFVVLECVDRLLQKGYQPNDIVLDGREGFADIVLHNEIDIYCEQWGIGGAAVYNCSRYAVRHIKDRNWILEAEFDGVKLSIKTPQSRSMKEAIVTIGGVSRDEIDPSTMMSRKIPGLYFAGEVIDIDGPTGGYNLTMAFATARLAVMSILMSRTEKSSFPRY